MEKRGPKPKGKVALKWSSNFAYAIGLLASDGNLSSDGRHIVFSSKDKELVDLFQTALGIEVVVGKKTRGYESEKKYYVVQFSDVQFYQFLLSIGLMPNKSKILGAVRVPRKYFFDFLRGSFDGDGCTYSYWDKRWRSSFMFYTAFASASRLHIDWMQSVVSNELDIKGHVTQTGKDRSLYNLRYAKNESLILLKKMFYTNAHCLSRKRLKIEKVLRIIEGQ